jgi:hypothetical protein
MMPFCDPHRRIRAPFGAKLLEGSASTNGYGQETHIMSEPTTKSAAKITRAKAELALSKGADPTLDMFTKHPNKHVKIKAEKLAARAAGATAIAAE